MIELEVNEYIDLYDPYKNYYLSVRIIEREDVGYKCKVLSNDKIIKIFKHHLNSYGYRKNWISEKILDNLGFQKNGFIYKLEDIIVRECLIGELTDIEHPYYVFEYSSKYLGYAIFKENELPEFEIDFKDLDFNSTNESIKEKYSITSSINTLFKYLLKHNSDKFSYEEFDKIIIK